MLLPNVNTIVQNAHIILEQTDFDLIDSKNEFFWLTIVSQTGSLLCQCAIYNSKHQITYKPCSQSWSMLKAQTALQMRGPTGICNDEKWIQLERTGNMLNRKGGFPIFQEGNYIGALGVSGFEEDMDYAIGLNLLVMGMYPYLPAWKNNISPKYQLLNYKETLPGSRL